VKSKNAKLEYQLEPVVIITCNDKTSYRLQITLIGFSKELQERGAMRTLIPKADALNYKRISRSFVTSS